MSITTKDEILKTTYTRRKYFREEKKGYYGNWQPNMEQVCVYSDSIFLEKGRVVKKEIVGNCENSGDEILILTYH